MLNPGPACVRNHVTIVTVADSGKHLLSHHHFSLSQAKFFSIKK